METVVAAYNQARSTMVKMAKLAVEFDQQLHKEKEKLRLQYAQRQPSPPNQKTESPPANLTSSSTNVECPACGKFVMYKLLNKHLDMDCEDPFEPPKTTSTSQKFFSQAPSKERKRIVAKVYDLMKDTQIRELAKSYSLATDGNRTVLIRRVKEYVTRYNANCESSKPKSNSEIRREVMDWERRFAKAAPTIGQGDSNTTNSQEAQQHIAKHKDQFDELIAQARMNRKRTHSQSESPAIDSS
jgi:E3 ubiquitin-protein ligase RAD18